MMILIRCVAAIALAAAVGVAREHAELAGATEDPMLRGDVLHHGQPIAHARVALAGQFAETDALGRFELPAAAGTLVAVTADGRARSGALRIDAGETRLEITLDIEASIEGQIVDDRGAPVPDVRVRAGRLLATTDGGGEFAFHALDAGVYEVRVADLESVTAPISVELATRRSAERHLQIVVRRERALHRKRS